MARDLGVIDEALSNYAISSGLSPKAFTVSRTGTNSSVGTVTPEDLWNVGDRLVYSTVPAQYTIVSTSAEDNPLGTGLHQVFADGVDGNYDRASETIELDGITPVTTVNEYLRVNLLFGSAPGSTPDTVAVGDITISDGANPQTRISAGTTRSASAMFTVYRGYTAFAQKVVLTSDNNDNYILIPETRFVDDTFTSITDFKIYPNAILDFDFAGGLGPIPEKSDLKFTVQATVGNASINAIVVFKVLRNDYLSSLANSI